MMLIYYASFLTIRYNNSLYVNTFWNYTVIIYETFYCVMAMTENEIGDEYEV